MKIVATCRTRNNEKIIGRFCAAYQNIADLILIADGGSVDDTVDVALSYPKVEVLEFSEKMDVNGGHWINPQGKHVNFLFDNAVDRGADWIIFDDSDCVPNFLLREKARNRFEYCSRVGMPAVFVRRVYFWGTDMVFPDLHKPNTGLWAFTPDSGVVADESDPWHLTMKLKSATNLIPLRPRSMHLEFPFCLLHYSWPSEEETEAKLNFYRESGVQPGALHPKDFAGPMEPAEWFMSEEPASPGRG